jgi:hypothetical protein
MWKTIAALLLTCFSLEAQAVRAEIKLDTKHLDDLPRQAVSQLARDIEYYIENSQWTFDELPADFEIQATLFLESYSESGYQKIYTGKAFWGNGDDQKYFDKELQFHFNEGDALVRSQSFNALTSFIDYWVLTILGGDLDTWTEFGGSQLYTEARQIARSGTRGQFPMGWKERQEDIEKLSRNQDYRRMKFAYYESIELWDSEQQKEALTALDNFFKHLETSKRRQESRILTVNFLNAKHRELGDFLYEIGNLDYLQHLIRIDEDHKDFYNEVLAEW